MLSVLSAPSTFLSIFFLSIWYRKIRLLILVCSFRFLGYRHIHLLGNRGESLGYASLFVHISIWGGSKPNKSSDRSSLSVRLQFVADIAAYQDVVILLR